MWILDKSVALRRLKRVIDQRRFRRLECPALILIIMLRAADRELAPTELSQKAREFIYISHMYNRTKHLGLVLAYPHLIYFTALTSISFHLLFQKKQSEVDRSHLNAQISILESLAHRLVEFTVHIGKTVQS